LKVEVPTKLVSKLGKTRRPIPPIKKILSLGYAKKPPPFPPRKCDPKIQGYLFFFMRLTTSY